MNAKQKRLRLAYNERIEWAQKANSLYIKQGDVKMKLLADTSYVAAGMIKRQIERENKLSAM